MIPCGFLNGLIFLKISVVKWYGIIFFDVYRDNIMHNIDVNDDSSPKFVESDIVADIKIVGDVARKYLNDGARLLVINKQKTLSENARTKNEIAAPIMPNSLTKKYNNIKNGSVSMA